ncbi:putative disease resistance protein RGA3 isoform X2 [Beta vulgaris subsp. vulgaris]|uniref:putative disease resistance protein RGA3 isoform X2 n=1 Tax=Beta vulgaris subsp. vulgaris TaxID=3555 RepID=UPI0020371945|nr:putative disease resistance protein RGA3 isoform X2 [Beta vulgaris subsp. vulgaris]
MAEGVISNLVAKALELLAASAFKEASSWWGARDDLKKLGKSMEMIQARVRDAEKYQEEEGSHAVKLWLRRLKLVLYQADDLFDHILTVDRQKQRRKQNHEHRVGPSPQMALLLNNRATTPFVEAEDVIGRECDKDKIVEMLFDPKYDAEKVTIIPIVGFGGLGKTTLAQFALSDQRVQNHFFPLKWAYVPEKNDRNAVMGKIFNSFTGRKYHNLQMKDLEDGIRESIKGNRYLLVLDDIWDESGDRLIDLGNLFKCGEPGSKVIVTTRSDVVAKSLGTIKQPYRLGTLTDDQSWNLFERLALKPRQEGSSLSSLSEIGKDIVKMCGNVPLAIKVVGGSLCSRDTPEEWLYVRDAHRSKAQHTIGSDIMPILKLSYGDLPPALKQCFAYCSLFKKGYKFSKTELVHLWMAQGYFEASSKDIGDRYFLELLRRNLFQDPKEDLEANITSCIMHDLVHDLAQNVAGHESIVAGESSSSQVTDGLIHVNLGRFKAPPLLFEARMLRSLFSRNVECDRLISNFKSLRVLSLKDAWLDRLPDSIGRLVYLRYLNLNDNFIKYLPQAITRLENLQTLNLQNCLRLKELPRDFTKLPNLRHLAIGGSGLTTMPPGFGTMTNLQELDVFVVEENFGIDSMPALNLMGNLHIKFCKRRNDAVLEAQRANLKGSQRLSNLTLDYRELEREKATPSFSGMNEMLMYLQLPPNLIYLRVGNYSGDKMQCRWLDVLSKLASIIISECNTCKTLPHLSQLPHLKNLYLERLDALEYVEDEDDIWVGEDCGYEAHYFPALENLELDGLPQLKRWTRPSKSGGEQRRQLFPRLFQMEVCNCKELVSFPLAPKLESLKVSRGNAKLFESNLVLHDDIPCKWLVGLSKIVSISISGCNNCTVLPHMSHLPLLKKVYLERLDGLEYVEDEDDILGDGDCGYTSHYFPALEKLNLISLPELKKWRRPSKNGGEKRQQRQLLFPHLLHMEVKHCKELVLMPLAPKLESLEVFRSNEKLFESNLASPNKEASSSLFTSLKHLRIDGTKDSLSISSRLCKLESVHITNGMELRSLMIESPSSIRDLQLAWVNSGICNILEEDFPFIETLEIRGSSEELEEGNTSTYWQGLKSLRSLQLHYMNNLKKLPPGIACLTNLQDLYIGYMKNLIALPDEIGNLSLLQKLTIARVEKLIALPEEIGNLSLLSRLEIFRCRELRILPLSLQGLTSLQELLIYGCPHLEERYSVKFNGRDRHLLQHIPDLQIRSLFSGTQSECDDQR